MSEETKKVNEEVASEDSKTEEIKQTEETNLEEEAKEEVLNPEDIEKEIENEEGSKKVNDVLADIIVSEKDKKLIKTTDIKVGMFLRIYQRIFELNSKGEEKSRLQMFEGLVIAKKHGNTPSSTFTVRKVTKTGHTVEKIYPTYLPTLEKVECMKIAIKRKSKLYYIRETRAKKIKFIK